MSNSHMNNTETTKRIFDDPVAYLARFGIEAEVDKEATSEATPEPVMPTAA